MRFMAITSKLLADAAKGSDVRRKCEVEVECLTNDPGRCWRWTVIRYGRPLASGSVDTGRAGALRRGQLVADALDTEPPRRRKR